MDTELIDKSNMKSILQKFPDMIKESLELGKNIIIEQNIRNICVTGMGGSAFSGDLLKTYLQNIEIPIFVNKTYYLPKYINKENSVLFAISYSGNTEETISAYRLAIKRGLKPISISSGGKLEKLSEINESPFIKIPKGYPPRLSTPFLFFPLLNILQNSNLIDKQDELIQECIAQINNPKIIDRAKVLSERIKNKIPIIYSSARIFCIAEKWKTDINENAKAPAFYNIFSEFNHNEINAYINLIGDYFVVIIKDQEDHERIKKRIKIIKKIIMEKEVDLMEISITGDNFLTRLISGIYLGLWVSYYLALEYHIDPTPVEIIENLKKELAK
jgi:glucose/mannose-6-phosphate isomerase